MSSPDLSPFPTTNHVLSETWTFLQRRAGHDSAINFIDVIGRSERLAVKHVTEHLEGQALRWLRRHDEREYSFVDATSFQVMSVSRIDSALAFDGDFSDSSSFRLRRLDPLGNSAGQDPALISARVGKGPIS